ncbi:gamma-glutamyltransferase [Immundisolibacter sp.]|uniref:gamma-glutamyltransferase n=1 Tax=Immundisolibacter sp. TaxID=1934948 RepID=UPI00356989C7
MQRLLTIVLVTLVASPLAAAPKLGAIASAHPLATEAGFEILAAGGNACDAAVAVSAALAVVEPVSSGIGGGAFYLIQLKGGKALFVDARERAPQSASRDMYLGEDGKPVREKSLNGPLAAGIPGEPAGLVQVGKRCGRLGLARNLSPAIRLATEGFEPDEFHLQMVGMRQKALAAAPAAAAVFLDQGQPPKAGFRLVQKDLAATLQRLARQGQPGFYSGDTARLLVEGVNAAGGAWTLSDLADYRAVERTPLRGRYHEVEVLTAPPPSSGGVALLTALNILEGYALNLRDPVTRKHLIVEAMRRAYRDRAEYLGDPDYVAMPLAMLGSKDYAAGLRAGIRTDQATSSASLPGAPSGPEGTDTTHFSVVDAAGNIVSATLSVNIPFGSGFMPPGSGVLLNDEMDDFSAKSGSPNAYKLIGSHANAIAPGKRPLSSMTPTILRRGDAVAVLGTPGGSRIISMVLLGTLSFAQGSDDPAEWVTTGRYHHQFSPDVVEYEPQGLGADDIAGLEKLGHTLQQVNRRYGNMQAIAWQPRTGQMQAASDPRRKGSAQVR